MFKMTQEKNACLLQRITVGTIFVGFFVFFSLKLLFGLEVVKGYWSVVEETQGLIESLVLIGCGRLTASMLKGMGVLSSCTNV